MLPAAPPLLPRTLARRLAHQRGGAAPTPTDITDGKITGSDVTFSVVRDMGGNSMTTKYSGTVTNGSIKGKIDMDMGGNPTSRDWEAKLQK